MARDLDDQMQPLKGRPCRVEGDQGRHHAGRQPVQQGRLEIDDQPVFEPVDAEGDHQNRR